MKILVMMIVTAVLAAACVSVAPATELAGSTCKSDEASFVNACASSPPGRSPAELHDYANGKMRARTSPPYGGH